MSIIHHDGYVPCLPDHIISRYSNAADIQMHSSHTVYSRTQYRCMPIDHGELCTIATHEFSNDAPSTQLLLDDGEYSTGPPRPLSSSGFPSLSVLYPQNIELNWIQIRRLRYWSKCSTMDGNVLWFSSDDTLHSIESSFTVCSHLWEKYSQYPDSEQHGSKYPHSILPKLIWSSPPLSNLSQELCLSASK